MFSISTRFNSIFYNMLTGMLAMGTLNFFSAYYQKEDTLNNIQFQVSKFDTFAYDRVYEEDMLAFQFDFAADIRPLFNWNTNIIFLELYAEFENDEGQSSQVVFWD